MSLLDVALDCASRGWHVFPCRPKTKEPAIAGGFKNATVDESQIRAWWTRWPDANVAIATGASGLCVLDVDHGIDEPDHLAAVMEAKGLPDTYVVRTGRRPGFGVQLYYLGSGLKSIAWADGELSGDIRCATGYVMAAGSVHPSGAEYERLGDFDVDFVPAYVRDLKPVRGSGVVDDGSPITEGRNNALTSIAGKLRNAGLSAAALEVSLLQVNADRCVPPLEDYEVRRIAGNAARWELPKPDAVATLKTLQAKTHAGGTAEVIYGGQEGAAPLDWRARYHTLEDTENCPPPSFLIEGFLSVEAIAAIAAPVAQRKSIIALNVARSLLSGQPLFGKFKVVKRPKRVLYCCPEMGLVSLAGRIKAMGMLPYVGDTFFYTTMNLDRFDIEDFTNDELEGAVVFLDTAIRFFNGNENDSEAMKIFADKVFALRRRGAEAVIVLHHSQKATAQADTLTLENAMRGSGDFGAFVTSAWATKLKDAKDAYRTPSWVEQVKARDFEAKPFWLVPDSEGTGLMSYLPPDGVVVERKRGPKQDRDGHEDTALDFLRSNPALGRAATVRALRERGIARGESWVRVRRMELRGSGVLVSAG